MLRLVVLILDIRREPSEDDLTLLRWLQAYRIPALCVLTKTDKLSRGQAMLRRRQIGAGLGMGTGDADLLLLFSAKTGAGRDALWKVMEEYL